MTWNEVVARRSGLMRLKTGAMLLALGTLLLAAPLAAEEAESSGAHSEGSVGIGFQFVETDAIDDRDGRHEKYSDEQEGLVVDDLNWFVESADGHYALSLWGSDLGQDDETLIIRTRLGRRIGLTYNHAETPFVYGDGARYILDKVSPGEHRFPDALQELWEDPNGDGVVNPGVGVKDGAGNFVLTDDDIALAPMVRDLLDIQDTFRVEKKRQTDSLELTGWIRENWNWDFEVKRDERRGERPFSTSTYGRVQKVVDFDHWFVLRGLEMPAPVNFETYDLRAAMSGWTEHWTGSVSVDVTSFDNKETSLTYDNPFFSTDTDAHPSGTLRGRYEEGQVSLEPDSDTWFVNAVSGWNWSHSTQLNLFASYGETTQNEAFLPYTLNTALIGVDDVDGDGDVDAADDPTDPSTLPQRDLDGKIVNTIYGFKFSSRPTDWMQVLASYRRHDYDAKHAPIVFPTRAEYVESFLGDHFQHGPIVSWPQDFDKDTASLDLIFRPNANLSIRPFYKYAAANYDKYVDLNADGHRDEGTRSVSGTDEDTLGITFQFSAGDVFDGWFTASTSDRREEGTYMNAFGGQHPDLLQWDIVDRDADRYELQLNFAPTWTSSIGANVRWGDTDYDTSYGLYASDDWGATLDFAATVGDTTTLSAYVDYGEDDWSTLLTTKCSNCKGVDPLFPTTNWNTPGYDWTSDIRDKSLSIGISAQFELNEKSTLAFDANHTKGRSKTTSDNVGTPPAQVGTAFDFPEQETALTTLELEFAHSVNEHWGISFRAVYEDWDLDDFMTDPIVPYTSDYMEIDDTQRYLSLDSRFEDYNAFIFQFLVNLKF